MSSETWKRFSFNTSSARSLPLVDMYRLFIRSTGIFKGTAIFYCRTFYMIVSAVCHMDACHAECHPYL